VTIFVITDKYSLLTDCCMWRWYNQ